MASSSSIQIAKVNAKLRQLTPEVRRRVAKVQAKAALAIEADAKRLAPVDTGALRASIRTIRDEQQLQAYVIAGGGTVNYARYQELGTSKMPAQPYLHPAFEAHRQDYLTEVRKAVRRAST